MFKDHKKIEIFVFQELNKTEVRDCVFLIDITKPYLGALPDGMIGNEELLEVKCPFKAANLTPK